MTAVEWHDIQGLILSGYASMHEARYLFLRVVDGERARQWITELANRVTVGNGPEESRCVNIALTCSGIAALGVDEADLGTFAVPFQEGMTAGHRQRVLGDTGSSAPANWAWGGDAAGDAGKEAIHALLMVFAREESTIDTEEREETERLVAGGLEVVHRLAPERLPGVVNVGKFGVEHFGFADGMSQPVIEGSGAESGLAEGERLRSVIAAGEFVLGYPNGYRQLTPWPRLSGTVGGEAFGRNGTYLVARQLAQDVAGFWAFIAEATKEGAEHGHQEQMVKLAAKLVGRWPSGTPLVLVDDRDDPDLGAENGFGYSDFDPFGERCPLGAHIRRANPRDSLGTPDALRLANLHRIIRRGRVYGSAPAEPTVDDGVDRGLMFFAINANLERQFEFVQHSWLNSPKFDGLYDEADALVGNSDAHDGRFTIQEPLLRTRLQGLSSFVTVRGGAYFFMPGVRALRMLGTTA